MKTIAIIAIFSVQIAHCQDTTIVWQKIFNNYRTLPTAIDTNTVKVQTTISSLLKLQTGDILYTGNVDNAGLIERRNNVGIKVWEMRLFGNLTLNHSYESLDGSIYVVGTTSGITKTVSQNFSTTTTTQDFYYSSNKTTTRTINSAPEFNTTITNLIDWDKAEHNVVLFKLTSDGVVIWQRFFGGSKTDRGTGIIKADGDNIWVIGDSVSPSDAIDIVGTHLVNSGIYSQYSDICAFKVSSNGEKQLTRFFGSSGNETITSNNQIVSTEDGGFALTFLRDNYGYLDGDLSDANPNELFHNTNTIFKVANNGTIQWKKYFDSFDFDNNVFMKIARQSNGEYYLLDQKHNRGVNPINFDPTYHSLYDDDAGTYSNNTNDTRVTKLSANGSILWSHYYGGKFEELAQYVSIITTADGGCMFISIACSDDGDVTGHKASTYYPQDIWIVKIDSSGTILWNRAFGGSDYEANHQLYTPLIATSENTFMFSGITRSSDGDVIGNTDGATNQNSWVVSFQLPCTLPYPTNVTTNQRICANTNLNLTANCTSGTSVKWYKNDGITWLSSLTVAPDTTTFYKIRCETNTNPKCVSAFRQVKIWVNINPAIPNSIDQTVCGHELTVLNANCSYTQGYYGTVRTDWFAHDGITPLINGQYQTPLDSINIYKVRCKREDNGYVTGSLTCVSNLVNNIATVKPKPNIPQIGNSSKLLCLGDNYTLSASCTGSSVQNWYLDFNSNSLTNLVISPTSNTYYYAKCESGGIPNCKSEYVPLNIIINSVHPNPPTITSSQNTITAGESTQLTASNCSGTVKWSFMDKTTNPLIISPNQTANITAFCTLNACTSNASSGFTVNVICPNSYNLSSTNNPTDDISSGTIIKKASASAGSITATNKITGTAKVTYQAKNIELNAGFKADNGTVFMAEIGGCN